MRLSCLRLAWTGLVALLLVALQPVPGWAQKANTEKVKFKTVDSVELSGTFYPSSRGKRAATVLLLPHVGGKSTDEVWEGLATKLQEQGHAVLAFDYRGHGDSTQLAVPLDFWQIGFNANLIKGYAAGKAPRETISRTDFGANYYPMLINDVTAAAIFLERKSDEGKCGMQNLVVVGAGDGATLGAMWLASEFQRFKVTTSTTPPLGQAIQWERTPEGQRMLCAVWLSISPTLGSNKQPPVTSWMQLLGHGPSLHAKKKPMAFIYGDADPAQKAFSTKCFREAIGKTKSETTAELGIRGTKLSGSGLLKSEECVKSIITYINNVYDRNKNDDWKESEIEKSGFVWYGGAGQPLIAKGEKETTFRLFPTTRFGVTIP